MTATATVTDEQLEEWAARRIAQNMAAKSTGYKHDAPGTPASTGYLHGPGGVLSYPGVDPDVFHTIVGPLPGILSQIPTRPTLFTNPTYEILTGITAGSGSEPAAVCDDAPVGGTLKAGIISAPFGYYQRRTREIQLARLGQRNDRADPVDLRLVGRPLQGSPFAGAMASQPADLLTNEMSTVMYERAIEWHRLLSRQIWTGNPTNNTPPGYLEMAGLQALVNTGYVDAINNQALPSVDSDVKDFGHARIDTNPGRSDIVDAITYTIRTRQDMARRMGVDPVRFSIAMRETLFYELTKVWPCSYMTNICAEDGTDTNFRFNIDQGDQIRMRDDMRSGRYLLVDGVRYDVVFDDGIPEDTNTTNGNVTSGCFASDIYILPMSIMGGRATLYLEHFDYGSGNPAVQDALGNMVLGTVSGNGAFVDFLKQTYGCVQWQGEIQPRLVLRTPWLAGRIQNVQYCPLQQTRQPYPDDPYFVDGGNTTRPGPSHYYPWQS